MQYKQIATFAFVLLVSLMILASYYQSAHLRTLHAVLGGEPLFLEVADTDVLRTQGLSLHRPLALNEGMLFIFPNDGRHGFWMKDMLFPIDILWLDSDYRIVDVKEHATPASYPEIFLPGAPARYVLEVSAEFFENHRLKQGDVLEILR